MKLQNMKRLILAACIAATAPTASATPSDEELKGFGIMIGYLDHFTTEVCKDYPTPESNDILKLLRKIMKDYQHSDALYIGDLEGYNASIRQRATYYEETSTYCKATDRKNKSDFDRILG